MENSREMKWNLVLCRVCSKVHREESSHYGPARIRTSYRSFYPVYMVVSQISPCDTEKGNSIISLSYIRVPRACLF